MVNPSLNFREYQENVKIVSDGKRFIHIQIQKRGSPITFSLTFDSAEKFGAAIFQLAKVENMKRVEKAGSIMGID